MSDAIVECVPNISEGRDRKKIEQILDAVREVDGVEILDVDPGAETNRTVITLVGAPGPIAEGAFRLIERAAQLIDMSKHHGAHPRHGATDVCPFVPVAGVTMDDCVEIARSVGKRVGEELGIPVYLYDQAAQHASRRSLADVRAGEYEALGRKLASPDWKPDFGPAKFLPRTGVATIGAREFLVAYNVNLNTHRKELAEDIASEIREKGRAVRIDQKNAYYSSGRLLKYAPSKGRWPCSVCEDVLGSFDELAAHSVEAHELDLQDELAFFGRDFRRPETLEGVNVMKRGLFKECRAVGWWIPEYGRAQISINLTNTKVTPIHEVYEACRRLAAERGIVVTGSEIVGLVPWDAIREAGEYYLARQRTSRGLPVRDVVRAAVQSLGLEDIGKFDPEKRILGMPRTDGQLASMRIADFADEVSRDSPAPGGGSVSALAGSMAAALAGMVANLALGKPTRDEGFDALEEWARDAQNLKDHLLRSIDEDTSAFNDVLAAMRLPKATDEEKARRDAAIQEGYKHATKVPLRTAILCLESMRLATKVVRKGLEASITDAGVGALLGRAGLLGAIYNVRINLGSIRDPDWVTKVESQLEKMIDEADLIVADMRALLDDRLAAR